MLQLASPVLKSHLKSRLSLLEVPLTRPTDILVGSGLPNLDFDFVEIGFCFLAAVRVAGLVVVRVVGLGVDVVLKVVLLVVLLVKTGAGAGVVVEDGCLWGARGMLGLARVVLEPAGTGKLKSEMRTKL